MTIRNGSEQQHPFGMTDSPIDYSVSAMHPQMYVSSE